MCKYYQSDKSYGNCSRSNRYGVYNQNNLNHVHDYSGRTELAGEILHDHGFSDTTSRGIPVGSGRHVHRYMNKTTIDVGHNHRMMGTTGIDIRVPGGNHVHDEKSVTSFNRGHRHGVKFTTSVARKTTGNGSYSSYNSYQNCSY